MSEQQEPEASQAKPWWKRWWGIATIAFVVLSIFGGLVGEEEADDEPATAAETSAEEPAGAPTPASTPDPEDDAPDDTPADTPDEGTETPEPAAEEPSGFGDGTHTVGADVEPGTYRSTGDSSCYWARLSGFGGTLDDIVTNGNNAPQIVAISPDDAGFETDGCGDWVELEETLPDTPAAEFDDGAFAVGGHIEPGTYRADGGSENCYWARLSGFSGELNHIIANGNSPTTIEISPGDAGFESWGCGTWTQTG